MRDAGWRVELLDHEELRADNAGVYLGDFSSDHFDLIWLLGFGPRQSFFDRLQILHLLNQNKLMNEAKTYAWAHGKSAWLEFAPPSLVSQSPDRLAAFMQTTNGDWILKPAGGSFGENVQRIDSAEQIKAVMASRSGYWVLQQFIPQISQGETRTLICRDQIIGSYLRVPGDQLRANLAQSGQAYETQLDERTRTLVAKVHQRLINSGVGYAAIDTVGGYVMEVNVANPGGVATLAEVYGSTFEASANERLLASINGAFGQRT